MNRQQPAVMGGIDRRAAIDWYQRNRERSRAIFGLVAPETYYTRPIALRNPIVFYEGHLPAFAVNTLIKAGLGQRGINDRLETVFARGIDPEKETGMAGGGQDQWPSREEVRRYVDAADRLILETLAHADLERSNRPALKGGEAVFTLLEHEPMHQETLLYMWHRVPYAQKNRPADYHPLVGGDPPSPRTVKIPAGVATLGADRGHVTFAWDNEFDEHAVEVPAFEIDVFNVTNRDYLEFVEAGGYDDRNLWLPDGWNWRSANDVRHPPFWERRNGQWLWRGMFAALPLPLAWPVYVTHAEATAYARWRGKRLPSEAEFHRAAFGMSSNEERSHPWGSAPPDPARGNFDFQYWDPVPVGSYPAGQSAWGVHDLVGNGWEWTSTVFAPFPGFRPMPSYQQYSADFFDGQHYVLKGASPATAKELLRRSLRNWFRPTYPYVYATFRCVRDA